MGTRSITVFVCDWCKTESKSEAEDPPMPKGWRGLDFRGIDDLLCGECIDEVETSLNDALKRRSK
jgi:hypothetical protein